jgi:hypothetical protein
MSTTGNQPTHLLGAVMDSVKTPEQADLVAPAMAPVKADFANHDGLQPEPVPSMQFQAPVDR